MALGILKTTKIDVCLLGILIVSLAYQVRKNLKSEAELVTDIAFLFFLAVFSPVLAVLIAKGGGTALYSAIANSTKQLTDIASNAIGVIAGKLI